MPKFMTYQRPMPVNRDYRGAKPGASFGKAGKQAPRLAPEARLPTLDIKQLEPKLPGFELDLPGLPKSR